MAIFLIVVLAALAAFAVQIAMAQYQAANIELLEARAQASANAGIEWAANLTLHAGTFCTGVAPVSKTFTLTQGALKGFAVTVACTPTQHQIYSAGSGSWKTYTVFALTATASSGTYGGPDYAARTVTRNVTDAPL